MKNSHSNKSGQYSKCSNTGICWSKIALQEVLYQKVQCHNSKSTCPATDLASWWMCCHIDSKTWRRTYGWLFSRNKFVMHNSFDIRKHINMVLNFYFDIWNFFSLTDSGFPHWRLWYFVSGLYWKIQCIISHCFCNNVGSVKNLEERSGQIPSHNFLPTTENFEYHSGTDILLVWIFHSNQCHSLFLFMFSNKSVAF